MHPGFPVNVTNGSAAGYSVFMTPRYLTAVTDVIHFYGWKSIIYLYDSDDGKS